MRFFLLGLGLFLVGCATSPTLEKFPRNPFDRPATLPEKVTTWSTGAAYNTIPGVSSSQYSSGSTSSKTSLSILNPLDFKYGLTDRWTLHMDPLPIAVTRGLVNSPDDRASISFSMRWLQLIRGSDVIDPSVSANWLSRINETFGWNTSVSILTRFELSSKKINQDFHVYTGPSWRVGEYANLSFLVGTDIRQHGGTLGPYGNSSLTNDEDPRIIDTGVYAAVGGVLGLGVSLSRNWDFNFSTAYAYENAFQTMTTYFKFTRFW